MSVTDGISPDGTIDLLSEQANRDPYPIYKHMREQCPVAFSDKTQMWWVTTYEDVAAVIDDPDNFKNSYPVKLNNRFGQRANEIMSRRPNVPATLTTADAPEHTNNRRPIQKAISPKRVRSLAPRIEEIARELMTKFRDDGGVVDFVPAFAVPFPLYVVAEFLGVPRSDFGYFEELAAALNKKSSVASGEMLDEDAQVRLAEQLVQGDEYLLNLMRDRRKAPREDFFTELVQMIRTDGTHFTEPELLDIAQMLALGGHETSSNALGVMVLQLATHPELQEDLRRNPEGIDAFVEESIRYATPVQFRTRRAEHDGEVRGCPVAAGQILAGSFASANRDPAVFPNPDKFDPSRPNVSEHLSFGRGVHHCLGSEIARAELRIALALMLEQMGDIRLADTTDEPYYWNRHPLLRGLGALHLAFTPLEKSATSSEERVESASAEHGLLLGVRSRVESAKGVVTLEFESTDGSPLPAWTPGAHIDVMIPGVNSRQYSLCGDPADRNVYRIAVLKEAKSRGGSRWIHESVTVGASVTVTGPRNHFQLEPADSYRFIAGGIGITPILAMIREAESAGADWSLLYGGRTRSSMAFLDELAVYGDRVVVSPEDEFGILDLSGWLAKPTDGTLIYACGPEPMLQATEKASAHWSAGSLYLERFAPSSDADLSRNSEFEVTIASKDLTVRVVKGQSIVEALRDVGVKITTNCGEGTCGTCETDVLEGIPDHRDSVLTDAEKATGESMCPCVSRSLSPNLVLDL